MAQFKIQESEKERILDLFINKNISLEKIGKIYKVSRTTIGNFLEKYKIRFKRNNPAKKFCDSNYFQLINSEDKAYFLGWMMSDGNITSKNKIQIMIQERDEYILKKFNCFLLRKNPLGFKPKGKKHHRNYCYITFRDEKIFNDLIKLGCVPKKSLILKFPNQIPNHLIHHFIRGYFDGDGSICINKKNQKTFSIISTKDFCDNINFIFNKEIGLKIKKLINHKNNINKIYVAGGNKQVKKIYEFLYKNASLYLRRKKKIFLI